MGALSKTAKGLIEQLTQHNRALVDSTDKRIINLAARMTAEDVDSYQYSSVRDPLAIAEMVRLIKIGKGELPIS